MKTNNLIRIKQVCTHYKVDNSFISALQDLGHIKVIARQNDQYIFQDQLKELESMIYFYTELKINIEGIDAIAHLLKQIRDLQDELSITKNKLSLYVGE